MIYIWLVLVSVAVIYLFLALGTVMDAVETIQEFKLEEYKELSNQFDEQLTRLENIKNNN